VSQSDSGGLRDVLLELLVKTPFTLIIWNAADPLLFDSDAVRAALSFPTTESSNDQVFYRGFDVG
jgi:hypothetical protein